MQGLTVAELMAQLRECAPEATITIWVDGERYEPEPVLDLSFEQQGIVELTVCPLDNPPH